MGTHWRRLSRHRGVLVGGALVVIALAALGAAVLTRSHRTPTREADAYLAAWSKGDAAAMRDLVASPATPHDLLAPLHPSQSRFRRDGKVRRAGDRATAPFVASLRLDPFGTWRYQGRLDLVRRGGQWRIDWSPATVHPALAPGQSLAMRRDPSARGGILGAGDVPLVIDREVVEVGIQPSRMKDQGAVEAALAAHANVSPDAVRRALAAPGVKPDHFVTVATLLPEDYTRVRPALFPVPGIVFRRVSGRAPAAERLPTSILGRTGPATKEQIDRSNGRLAVGDVVGQTGIEGAYEDRLAGRPTGVIEVRDASGTAVKELRRFAGRNGEPVRTTLDPEVQRAADTALDAVTQPAAIVALDSTNGNVLAVALRPAASSFNRAFVGRYPPGSTFKVVTTLAFLRHGITPDTPTPCAPSAVVGGRSFKNFESGALGTVPFAKVFEQSCNTGFVTTADRVGGAALSDAAASFGFNSTYSVGLRTFGGSFPSPRSQVEVAAQAIGQGRDEASPLHMASVAAAVASGTWRPPAFVADPPPPGSRPADVALEPPYVAALRSLMRRVVVSGSGTAANVAGQPVMGKTGTAEFGSGDPLPTHAWFIGFRGNLAVAILVEGGGVGGRVAAPLAGTFFRLAPTR